MKKIYTIASALMLVLLLGVGFYALLNLDPEPNQKATFGSVLKGTYFSETFPQSASLKNMNTKLNGFYKFSALSGDVSLIIDMNSGAANGGEALKPTDPPTPTGDATDPATNNPSGATDEPTEPSTAEPTEYQGGGEDGVVENLGSAILVGDRAVEIPYGNYDTMETYSDAITNIATALGSDVRTFSIAVPNGAEFYTPADYHTGSASQSKMIAFCYENMGKNVLTVDAYSKLAAHTDEYIYFRTDHHWTQLGAYYAYTAFCESAGFAAEPLSKFETGEYTNFVGSMYTFLGDYPQAAILRQNPDTLEYYRPFVDISTNYYTDASLSTAYPIGTISYIEESVSNKYLCFLGGDHPVTIIETNVEGPVVMLLKESYGNAFAPWLTSHYSKVIVVDPREFNRDGKPTMDLVDFAKEQGVDDCIILNYPMMLSSGNYIDWLNRLVD